MKFEDVWTAINPGDTAMNNDAQRNNFELIQGERQAKLTYAAFALNCRGKEAHERFRLMADKKGSVVKSLLTDNFINTGKGIAPIPQLEATVPTAQALREMYLYEVMAAAKYPEGSEGRKTAEFAATEIYTLLRNAVGGK